MQAQISNNNKIVRGFTLIELLITVAIIGTLTAIALPSYQDTVRKARRSDAYDSLLDCATAMARHYTTSSPQTYLSEDGAVAANICGSDGTSLVSNEGYYNITISNNNCESNGNFWCFTAVATATGSQANDASCSTFSVDHTGNQTSTDSSGAAGQRCWRS